MQLFNCSRVGSNTWHNCYKGNIIQNRSRGRGWHIFAGLDPEKNMKILPQCQGLLRPSSIEVQVQVQVLDKKGEDEKMPEKVVHMCLDWSLLKILCDVPISLPATPQFQSFFKSLHHSSFTPPATLLLYFPCGAWGETVNLRSLKNPLKTKKLIALYCPVGLAAFPPGL